MALLSLCGVSLRFGGLPLLDHVDLHVAPGNRLCILGANGAGKSSLLKLLAELVQPDEGTVARAAGTRVTYLPQDVPTDLSGTLADIVCPDSERDSDGLALLAAEQLLRRQGMDPGARFETLSGGNRRRALLARALLGKPDVVLLDEPTNHLDLDSIRQLEETLLHDCPTFVFVTHDRAFLRRVANRIVELDRGRIVDWACDYDTFLRRKSDVLQEEARLREKFDARLKLEEAWLRQGCKARTSRDQGRLRRLLAMRAERAAWRNAPGSVRMSIQQAERSGNIVLKALGISFAYSPDRPLLRNLDTIVMRGDRIGIVGPNGCGKTTLVRLLLGDELKPERGEIVRGTNLRIAYSDQLRSQLDDSASLLENIADDHEFVHINGVRRHVTGYLADFLFEAERVRQPVSSLSGGERSRLLLAKLFAQPSNVLVLDEPTNDLDLDTLELLEERISDYDGTVILVSHDRTFLNNIATSLLVFEKFQPEAPDTPLGENDGWSVNDYAGGYDDWHEKALVREREALARAKAAAPDEPDTDAKGGTHRTKGNSSKGISYNERRELAALPERIEALEARQADLQTSLADPVAARSGDPARIPRLTAELSAVDAELSALYARWEELETKQSNADMKKSQVNKHP